MHNHATHTHQPGKFNLAFAIAVGLNSLFVIIEVVYALAANSSSLLADAGHNLGDILGLVLAWGANWLLTRESKEKYSYGFRRTTILAALGNALLLVLTSAIISFEAIDKLFHPEVVHETTIIVVALIGIVINGGTALLFMKGSAHDLNIKGAFLHLATDALISLGVVLTGIVILYTQWYWFDPFVGLIIVITILMSTWGLLRDSVNLILDAVPHHIDQQGVKKYLCQLPGVTAIHDLHIWGLSTYEVALTAHLVMPESTLSDEDHKRINDDLLHRFQINHVTLQVEKSMSSDVCNQCC